MHVLEWYMLYRDHFLPDEVKPDIPAAGALAAAKSAGIPAGGVHTAVDWLGEAGIALMGDHRAVEGVYGVYVGCAAAA